MPRHYTENDRGLLTQIVKEESAAMNNEVLSTKEKVSVIESDLSETASTLTSMTNQLNSVTDKTNLVETRTNELSNQVGSLAELGNAPRSLSKSLSEYGINVKDFGAKGDGIADDTAAIQAAIDYANTTSSRKVFFPKGDYLISAPILLNGCTLEGPSLNIYDNNSKGACFIAKTKDFIAIKQGSLSGKDIQFNIKNIYVKDALIGFEINYAINSTFERLYVKDCDTGYKLGDPTAVGSMFCEFNNLYSLNTRIGAIVQAKDYFNNNRFNNGFITGTEKSFHLEVTGGYGAVNNVFNNVEFRSPLGRGVVLKSSLNTTFNNCYFEIGGNAIRTVNYCQVNVNKCIFGVFKATNTNADTSFVFAEGGVRLNLDGGVIFLSSENTDTSFYDATDLTTHLNVYMYNAITLNGTATGFIRFKQPVNEAGYKKEEQVITTNTVTILANSSATLDFTYPSTFTKNPEVVTLTMRGNAGEENAVHYILFSRSIAGGSISLRNNSTSAKSVNFNIFAKTL